MFPLYGMVPLHDKLYSLQLWQFPLLSTFADSRDRDRPGLATCHNLCAVIWYLTGKPKRTVQGWNVLLILTVSPQCSRVVIQTEYFLPWTTTTVPISATHLLSRDLTWWKSPWYSSQSGICRQEIRQYHLLSALPSHSWLSHLKTWDTWGHSLLFLFH